MFVRLPSRFALPACVALLFALLLTTRADAQVFTSMRHALPGLRNGALAWADYDADGWYDLIMTGVDSEGRFRGLILHNDGDTVYVEGRALVHETRYSVHGATLAVEHAAIAWADVNADGRPDFILSGRGANGVPSATLYLQDASNAFAPSPQSLRALHSGHASWADFDRDADLDLLLCGIDAEGVHRTDLYENVGGVLTRREVGLPGFAFGGASWGDLDGDGWPDLALTGVTQTQVPQTAVYRNDQVGGFAPMAIDLEPLVFGSVAWGDYDADGAPDLLLSGGRWSPFVLDGVAHIYRNTGATLQPVAERAGAYYGAATWGDFDNDGVPDALISGGAQPRFAVTTSPTGGRAGVIYAGRDGQFDSLVQPGVGPFAFGGGYRGDVTAGDYDGDGDLDFVVTGVRGGGGPFTDVWRNEGSQPGAGNEPPQAPTDVRVEAVGGGMRVVWNAASDRETPAAGLTYNVRVGRDPGAADVLSPAARSDNGRLLIPRGGNAGHSLERMLRGLAPGRYFVAVQAVDAGLSGSRFSDEVAFDVP